VQHLLDPQGILRPDQGMPVVGHQNVTAEQEPQPLPRSFQHVDKQRVFRFVESPEPRANVHAEKKDTVAVAQAMDV
jgi:hypothetical protein